MSTIDKLGICGFRSYSSTRIEKLTFLKPVTLILGQNGSGKTTILETLKFAISGILPPNSQKGKYFIRDPQMDKKTETKASVKLLFNAINGKPILCARSLSFTRTSKKETFRRIEQFLRIKSKLRTETIGHTCVEIDKQVPDLMGVSKAVLENVILCHQENSNWPFSDKIVLKKIFDDLFDTTIVSKYVECCRVDFNKKKKILVEILMEKNLAKKDFEHYVKYLESFEEGYEFYQRNQKSIFEFEQDLKKLEHYQDLTNLEREIGKCESYIKNFNDDLNLNNLNRNYIFPGGVSEVYQENIVNQKILEFENNISQFKSELEEIINDKNGQHLNFLQKSIKDLSYRFYNEKKEYDFYDVKKIERDLEDLIDEKKKLKNNYDNYQKKKELIEINFKNSNEEYLKKMEELEQGLKKSKKIKNFKQAKQLKEKIEILKLSKLELEDCKKENMKILEDLNLKKKYLGEKRKFLKKYLLHKEYFEKKNEIEKIKKELYIEKYIKVEKIKNIQEENLNNLKKSEEKINSYKNRLRESITILKLLTDKIIISKKNIKNHKTHLEKNKIIVDEKNPFQKYFDLKKKIIQNGKKILELKTSKKIFLNFIDNLEKDKRCKYCSTDLKKENFEKIILKMKKKIFKIEKILEEMEPNLEMIKIEKKRKKKLKYELRDLEKENLKLENLEKEKELLSMEENKIEINLKNEKNYFDLYLKKNEKYNKLLELEKIKIDKNKIDENLIIPKNFDKEEIHNIKFEKNENLELISNEYNKINKLDNKINNANNEIFLFSNKLSKLGIDLNEEIIEEKKNINYEEEIVFTQNGFLDDKQKMKNEKKQIESFFEKLNKEINYNEQLEEKIREYLEFFNKSEILLKKKKLKLKIEEKTKKLSHWKNHKELIENKKTEKELKKKILEFQNKKQICLEKEKNLLEKKKDFDNLKQKINNLKGQSKVQKKNLKNILNLIKKNKNIEIKYIKLLTKYKTTEKIINDIKKFSKQLERSLIKHHILKIDQINKIINKIWKMTYSGKDIKSIKIKSQIITSQNKLQNRKNYDYGILYQNQNGDQIDMKGKSSTGQKVLASIVIRLALSEAFCVNCGLLALDEPTTNLDGDNIFLLAGFLKRLVEVRREQRGFQLVVITHDKEFLELIGTGVEEYYEVEKDEDGFSKIRVKEFHK